MEMQNYGKRYERNNENEPSGDVEIESRSGGCT